MTIKRPNEPYDSDQRLTGVGRAFSGKRLIPAYMGLHIQRQKLNKYTRFPIESYCIMSNYVILPVLSRTEQKNNMKTRKQIVEENRQRIAQRAVDSRLKRGIISLETTEFVRLKPEPKKSHYKRNPRYSHKLNAKGKPLTGGKYILSERMYKYFMKLKEGE
jgi:hypothetical protein